MSAEIGLDRRGADRPPALDEIPLLAEQAPAQSRATTDVRASVGARDRYGVFSSAHIAEQLPFRGEDAD